MITTIYLTSIGLFCLFVGLNIRNAHREEKKLERELMGLPKAGKPTKKQIAERNHIDWLLMPEEWETGNPVISLNEHEKAIS